VDVIGHRGAAALAPENTRASFDAALALGVDAVETDVRATGDGLLVLLHDRTLDRTTDGVGPVADVPWATVRTLDAGAWYGEAWAGERVLSAREMLSAYGERTRIVLEIKQPGIEAQLLDLVRALHLLDRVTFTSFAFDSAVRVKALCRQAKVGYLSADVGSAVVGRALDAGLEQFCPAAREVTAERVTVWHDAGLEVRAWGVRDVGLMQRAVAAGVDGMTIDDPRQLLSALGREFV
jgi:glycerophosphoryl diester phosphodiesterase